MRLLLYRFCSYCFHSPFSTTTSDPAPEQSTALNVAPNMYCSPSHPVSIQSLAGTSTYRNGTLKTTRHTMTCQYFTLDALPVATFLIIPNLGPALKYTHTGYIP